MVSLIPDAKAACRVQWPVAGLCTLSVDSHSPIIERTHSSEETVGGCEAQPPSSQSEHWHKKALWSGSASLRYSRRRREVVRWQRQRHVRDFGARAQNGLRLLKCVNFQLGCERGVFTLALLVR